MDSVGKVFDSVQKKSTTNSSPKYLNNEAAIDQASHNLVISSSDELHWYPDMDYQYSCDNLYRSPHSQADIDNSTTAISLTAHSDLHTIPSSRLTNKNFDIHLAQIDIETFKSEDIEKLRKNSISAQLENSSDTLRIVDSLTSLNLANNLQVPSDDCEALSIDSLDISIGNEINSKLIQKCTENDKTCYKIAMIDTSAHSQLQNSLSTSDCDFYSNTNNNYLNNGLFDSTLKSLDRPHTKVERSNNPFSPSPNNNNEIKNASASPYRNSEVLQSPGSFVQMFIQNKIHSNESSILENGSNGNYLSNNNISALSNCDNKYEPMFQQQQTMLSYEPSSSYATEGPSPGNSLNTVDSNELPLHVLDLSKKLRSMNLTKHGCRYGSTSMSSNTSYTSTTTSSSATNADRRKQCTSTNPFLPLNDDKKTKNASTQFPELFQDKEVQASFDDEDIKDAPVLVYYPNYSLPDLSFLQDIFKKEKSNQQIFLSPVKHEPPNMKIENSVNRRGNKNSTTEKKSRPKSYADYETLLTQDFSHIKDWESLNLLLPEDFKEFIEKNNLINSQTTRNTYANRAPYQNTPLPIKATIPNVNRRLKTVKHRSQPSSKRYSLQEHTGDMANYFCYNHPPEVESQSMGSYMTRSQTMPNCGLLHNPHVAAAYCPNHNMYRNCCRPCCHSTCHSPSFHSSQSSPQKPNFNWDILSSSSSFKKLLSFLNKLDECSSHSDSSKAETQRTQAGANNFMNNCYNHEFSTSKGTNRVQPEQKVLNSTKNIYSKESYVKTVDFKPSQEMCSSSKNQTPHKVNLRSKATSPISSTKRVSSSFSKTGMNGSERNKVILKRPTSLNKTNNSSIPVPKRTSSKSMIPVPRNTQIKEYRSKERTKSGNTRF